MRRSFMDTQGETVNMDIFGPSNVGWKVSDDGKTVTLINRKWDNRFANK